MVKKQPEIYTDLPITIKLNQTISSGYQYILQKVDSRNNKRNVD